MLVLDKKTKQFLKESLKADINENLTTFYKNINKLLKEDAENTDLSGFQNRCNWVLSKIVDDRSSLAKYSELDAFKNIFKNVAITQGEDKVSVTVDGNEVLGNTRFLSIVMMIVGFGTLLNLQTLGEKFNDVGGTLIEKFSESLTLELGKRCDLSKYSLNGDVIRSICKSIHGYKPVINIFVTLLAMQLLKDQDKAIETNILLLIKGIKGQAGKNLGYLYTFLVKSGEFTNVDLEFLSKDIYYQLKSI